MPNVSRLPAIMFLVAVLALPACGGGDAGTSADSATSGDGHSAGGHSQDESVHEPVEGAQDVQLTAVDIDYEPAQLELKAGEPANVTVANKGETVHDFTLEEADVHMNVDPGKEATTSVTVDDAGEYKAICSVPGHADAGMVVDVTVTP